MAKNRRVVAAFDFDGTITYCDSLLPFLLLREGPLKAICHFAALSPLLFRYLLGRAERREVKEAILTKFFRGRAVDELTSLGESYALGALNRLVRKKALKRIAWHRSRGDRCLLISASIDTYLRPWAKSAGFSDLISSKLEVDGRGIATGKLFGENCRGAEKLRRLEELLGSVENYTLYAYGDSDGDSELLAAADYPFYRTMGP